MDMISAIFGFLKGLMKVIGLFQEDVREEKDHAEGANQVAVEEIKKTEEERVANEKLKAEIGKLPDTELDARLDEWMRD